MDVLNLKEIEATQISLSNQKRACLLKQFIIFAQRERTLNSLIDYNHVTD